MPCGIAASGFLRNSRARNGVAARRPRDDATFLVSDRRARPFAKPRAVLVKQGREGVCLLSESMTKIESVIEDSNTKRLY
jgi:hypothetical protein